jgi:hypothetical protein
MSKKIAFIFFKILLAIFSQEQIFADFTKLEKKFSINSIFSYALKNFLGWSQAEKGN